MFLRNRFVVGSAQGPFAVSGVAVAEVAGLELDVAPPVRIDGGYFDGIKDSSKHTRKVRRTRSVRNATIMVHPMGSLGSSMPGRIAEAMARQPKRMARHIRRMRGRRTDCRPPRE
jgi:hypothetical protein